MPAPTGSNLPAPVAPWGTVASAANTYYVDPSIGSDSNSITQARSTSTPWLSLTHALNTIPIPSASAFTPTQILIRGDDGTNHRGFAITATGPGSACPASFQSTSVFQARQLNFPKDSPLIISNFPGERVLIGFPYLHSFGDSYICWRGNHMPDKRRGLVFDSRYPAGNTAFSGWATHGGSHIELFGAEVRNNIWDGAGGGVYVGGYDFTAGTQVATDIQLISCFIHHNGGNTQGAHGVYYGGTSNNAKGAVNGAIYNCLIVFNTDDNLDPHNTVNGTVIANNVCAGYGGGGTGSGVSATPLTGTGKTYGWTSGINAFSNTPTDPASTNVKVANNLLTNNLQYGFNDFDSAWGSTNLEKNNLYFGNGTGNRHATAGMSLQSTLLNNDPQYVSGFNGTNSAQDFHLKTTSPAVDAGDPTYTPNFDYDGVTRTTSDIGPYAVGGTAVGGTTIGTSMLLMGVGQVSVPGGGSTSPTLDTVPIIIRQMEPPNEGTPISGSGIGSSPMLSYNMPPPNTSWQQGWGVISFDASNTLLANTRVEIKNWETYNWWNSQSKWVRVQSSLRPSGAYYQFTGGGGTSSPAPWQIETDGGESAPMQTSWVLHFFPGSAKYTLPASGSGSLSDIGGTFTTYQARLIVDTASTPDNRNVQSYLAQSGCDWWAGTGGFGPPVPNTTIQNVALGGGTWIYLNANWRAVTFYTGGPSSVITASTTKYQAQAWTETQLTNNPPPLDGMGLP